MIYIGAHINKRSNLKKTLDFIREKEGNALQIFTSNPRSFSCANIDKYKKEINDINLLNNSLVIHASYTINIASSLNENKRIIDIEDTKWFNTIISDLKVANLCCNEKIRSGVVLHVGKFTSQTKKEGLKNMENAIHNIISYIKKNKLLSQLVLETAAGQGTELLVDIDELISFYNKINEPDHFKLCFDTCHVWVAGFNIVDAYNKIQNETSNAISIIHLNGSKVPFGSKKDRHANILHDSTIEKEIMIKFLKNISNTQAKHACSATSNITIIIETPDEEKLKEEIIFVKKNIDKRI